MTVTKHGSCGISFNRLLLASLIAAPLAFSFAAKGQDADVLAAPAAAVGSNSSNTEVWRQFSHYTLISRVDLANKAAEVLNNDSISGDQLLAAIEGANTRYQDVEKILADARNMDGLKTAAEALSTKIQTARIAHAKDSARILADIKRLGEGSRVYADAVARLKASGPYAAPYYISVLQDPTQDRLHPYVLAAMGEVGDSLAYPLAVALPHLDATTAERVATILADARHPVALPFLKMAMENTKQREMTRKVFAAAYSRILTRTSLPETAKATELFTHFGESIYRAAIQAPESPAATLNTPVAGGQSVMWEYVPNVGLTAINVSSAVLPDHLAMQMAESALALDPKNGAALNLYLASNSRRENRMNGQPDKAYPETRLAPALYMLLAGPDQQQAVLIRALDAHDSELALDAIDAMSKTIDDYNFEGNRQPLIECLTYGDARVRYSAALALANAAPKSDFPGSSSVVPIMSQIIRASAEPNALVVASTEGANMVGATTSALEKAGFKMAVGGRSLAEAKAMGAPVLPNTGLIVYTGSLQGFNNLMAGVHGDGLYRTVPVLALVDTQTAAAIHVAYPMDTRISTADISLINAPQNLEKATKLAISSYIGLPLDTKMTDDYTTEALAQLREIASTPSVYNAQDARLALESALSDVRPAVAVGAAHVLEKFNRADSQNALIKAALASTGDVQEAQLGAIAKSFEAFGNKADANIFKQLVDELQNSPSLPLARAVGAGRPSPDLAVGAIISKGK